jgi:outer membrane receptor protein involved in Fe transport
MAQNAPRANQAKQGTALSEVVVTAQKRSENLQKIPVAVTAFTAQVRDRSGLNTAQQILNFTPGVTYDPATDHLDIRGVGRVTTYIGTDPGVAVYQDGFYVVTAAQLNNQSTLLSERTEILRGPQGTLYGRNSIGGALNIISRRPDDEYTGDIRASFNDYMGATLEARASGPVTDWLKLSMYVEHNYQKHGYYTIVPPTTAPSQPAAPAVTGIDGTGHVFTAFPALPAYPAATCASLNFAAVQPQTCDSFRGSYPLDGPNNGWIYDFQASYNPTPNFDGWIKANFQSQYTAPGYATGITEWNPVSLTVPSVWWGYQPTQNPGLLDQRHVTLNGPAIFQNTNEQLFITQDTWHAPSFDVKFIGGFWSTKGLFGEDGDSVGIPTSGIYSPTFFGGVKDAGGGIGTLPGGVANPPADPFNPGVNTVQNANNLQVYIPSRFQAWSTELNISSTDKGPLQWLAGLYYYNEVNKTGFTYQETSTPQYDNVTDYLFNSQTAGCYPVLVAETNFNVPIAPGKCAFSAAGLGTIANVFSGYYGTTPTTVNNAPHGALDKLFGFNTFGGGYGNGCLYCFNAFLNTQSEALFGQLDWRPNDQWHFTGGVRYSWDQKQGYEQEIDVFWIPLVANEAQAAALGFPTYPADFPEAALRGHYVTNYVGTSCSSPGLFGIVPLNGTIQSATGPTGAPLFTTNCPAHRSIRDDWHAPTGTAGVEWTPNNDTNVYVRYNRGYKSGGFNLGPLAATTSNVNPEYIDDFEGGYKASFFHRLQVNIAGFYYLYHGLQALNETTQNSSPPIQINELINIPKSHAWGIEMESQWTPIDNLLVAVNFSYLNTTNDTACVVTGTPPAAGPGIDPNNATLWTNFHATGCYVDAANPNAATNVNGVTLTNVNPVGPFFPSTPNNQPQSLKGNPLPYSPPFKVGVNLAYTFHFDPGDLTASAVWNWHDAFYDNLFSTQQWLVPHGQTTDFRITWASSNKRYQVIGTISNAFNSNVWISHTSLPPGNGYYAYNEFQPPRIFAVELRYHF